jgi:hypothetical protein
MEVRFVDLIEVTTAKGIDAELELCTQRLELELVLTPTLLLHTQRVADRLARILIVSRVDHFLDEGILLSGEADVARRHLADPTRMTKSANRVAAVSDVASQRPRLPVRLDADLDGEGLAAAADEDRAGGCPGHDAARARQRRRCPAALPE